MKLSELIEDLEIKEISGNISWDIKSISYDSKHIEQDSLFVAIKGLQSDGHNYIEESVSRGAKAVLLENREKKIDSVSNVVVADTRVGLAKVACRLYNHPSAKLKMIGITGTNGKTTTLYLIESILKEAGFNVGTIGTINYHYGKNTFSSLHTTPESLDLQNILRDMVNTRVTHAVLEVSSHALALSRLEGCQFDVGVFTNLTRDHLDYHRNMEEYFKCKERLFTQLLNKSISGDLPWRVVNLDDPRGKLLLSNTKTKTITYGMNSKSQVTAKDVKLDLSGINARIITPQGDLSLQASLLGELNLYNIMAAVAVGITQGISLKTIKRGVEEVKKIPGRLERVENNRGMLILIDYAHTSDALEKLLISTGGFSSGKIITVFGCGGERDRGKRPLMGAISAKYSDFTIITSDNPRNEDSSKIIEEIEAGIVKLPVKKYHSPDLRSGFGKKGYAIVRDRREAIKLAVSLADSGDLVVIAGKGHEDYQVIGKKKIAFDDRDEVREALAAGYTEKLN